MTSVYIILAGIVAIVGALIIAYGKGVSAGKTTVRAETAEDAIRLKKQMDKAANTSAKTHGDLVKELEDGGKL